MAGAERENAEVKEDLLCSFLPLSLDVYCWTPLEYVCMRHSSDWSWSHTQTRCSRSDQLKSLKRAVFTAPRVNYPVKLFLLFYFCNWLTLTNRRFSRPGGLCARDEHFKDICSQWHHTELRINLDAESAFTGEWDMLYSAHVESNNAI